MKVFSVATLPTGDVINSIESENSRIRGELISIKDLKKTIQKLEAKNSLNSQVSTSTNANDKTDQSIKELQREISSQESINSQIAQLLNTANKKSKGLEDKSVLLTKQLKNANKDLTGLRSELSKVKKTYSDKKIGLSKI